MRCEIIKAFGLLGSLFAALSLPTTGAQATNILANPGFESGALAPWFQSSDFCSSPAPCENWNVTNSDAHSGTFSATDVGNKEIRQNFAAIPEPSSLLLLSVTLAGLAAVRRRKKLV